MKRIRTPPTVSRHFPPRPVVSNAQFNLTPPLIDFNPPYNIDRITINNWSGGEWYRVCRGSKKRVWACQMFFNEGFIFNSNEGKIIGKYSDWFIIDGAKKYIMSVKIFRKTFFEEERDGKIF